MATDNEKKTLDYGDFLADLEAKRSVLDQAIASVRAVMASGALALNVGDSMPRMAASASVSLHGGEVPAGAFHGKSIPEAAKLYLSIVKTKRTTKEIADGLREGGMETRGKNFEIIVGSALYRIAKNPGEIVRVKGAWGLAEWWPAGVRTSQEKGNGRKAKKVRPKSAKATLRAESNGQKKPQEQIAELLRSNPTKTYTLQDVSEALNLNTRGVGLTLGRLAAKNQAEKVETGKYRAAHG